MAANEKYLILGSNSFSGATLADHLAAEGHDVSIQALSKHEHGGASFADFAANAKELTGNKD